MLNLNDLLKTVKRLALLPLVELVVFGSIALVVIAILFPIFPRWTWAAPVAAARPVATYAVGKFPYAVVLADFNGDGKPDIAVTNGGDNSLSILINNGNGSFGVARQYATGSAPGKLASGDLNGDGKLDLVVANRNDNTISILLNDGHGAFRTWQTYNTGTFIGGLAVGDFHRHGRLDLAVTSSGDNSVEVFTGNGDGTFQPFVAYNAGNMPVAVSIGDFNGDGKMDLAVANFESTTMTVLLNNGHGAFPLRKSYEVGMDQADITVGDLNGDGKPDLVVTLDKPAPDNVIVLQNDSKGAFLPATAYSAGDFTGSVALARLNHREKASLILSNYENRTISILRNQGNGQLRLAMHNLVGNFPQAVAASDLTGDGVAAIVTVNTGDNTISVLLTPLATGSIKSPTATTGITVTAKPGTNPTATQLPSWSPPVIYATAAAVSATPTPATMTGTPTPTAPLANVAIQVENSKGHSFQVGDTISYKLIITNTSMGGPDITARSLKVSFILPPGLTYIKLKGKGWTINGSMANSPLMLTATYASDGVLASGTSLPALKISGILNNKAVPRVTSIARVNMVGDGDTSDNKVIDTILVNKP